MPTAAETKFWTVRPTVWTIGVAPISPAYDCQLVLVTNETAVFRAVVTPMPSEPWLRGSRNWTRMSVNSAAMLTREKAMTLSA